MFGTDSSWVASTPALPGAGALELASTGADPMPHALVGGPSWGADSTGFQTDSGLTWLAAGPDVPVAPAGFAHGAGVRAGLDDWRNLFNPGSPSFWILAALLVAVGFIHLRVNTKIGPAHGNVGLG
jgi:hypothetical protein